MKTRRWLPGLLIAGVLLCGAAAPGLAAEPTRTGKASPGKDRTITLITGDRVVLQGGSREQVSIERGRGREHVSFESRRTGDEWSVIPSDVRAALRSGQLDKRLFDLDLLLSDGYDDASRADIPLLVTGAPVQNRLAKTVRTLTAATAVSVPKQHAPGFLTQARQRRSGGKIWLDRKLHTTLDKSVPQIGAPAAWQAGYTGKGVTVAVLDSGVDATHPDLAGQVVNAKNFTTDPAADIAGHGTHVASTIAGKGAAGYRGVAPDAKLLDGKVCDDIGDCSESSVLAGMEWAVAQQAKVVNLSVGGPGGDELDPLEEAVNRLTAQTGTLFVVAAGNRGGPESVDSPGTADAALTVGAVDRTEQLADFSGQGPAAGGAIKPDVTAPGVGIVAARSAGSHPEEPVGDKYARMSGTSMATPHVAGAAALLVQQHSAWRAGELKSALMASTKPSPALTAYEQGAGRVDLGRAVGQSVIAVTPSVSFGVARWPHADDTVVSREVKYRNLGTAAVTLDLVAELRTAGQAAPAGALKLSAQRITVPAGGESSVQVVSDTTHSGADGLYSGRLTATGGAQQVVVPLVVDKEVESYDVAVRTLGADGKPVPAGSAFTSFQNLQTGNPEDGSGKVVRLPRGKYVVDSTIFGPKGEHYRLVQPELEVHGPGGVLIDARRARPVRVSVPRPDASGFVAIFGYRAQATGGPRVATWNFAPRIKDVYLGRIDDRAVSGDQFTAFVFSYLGKLAPDGSLTGSPYLYGLADTRQGRFFDGLQRRVYSDRQLAHVVAHYDGPAGTETSWRLNGRHDGVDVTPIGADLKLPATVQQYLEPRTEWRQAFDEEIRQPRSYPLTSTTHEYWKYPTR